MTLLSRVTYRGAALFGGNANADIQIDRATAFGSTGTLNKEDAFEIGNSGIVDVIEDVNEVSMTIDAYEHGSERTLALFAGKDPDQNNEIDFSKDFETAKFDIWSYIKGPGDVLFTQYMENCFLTGYSANFVTDGNSTESYSLVSDNKRWLLNNFREIGRQTLSHNTGSWVAQIGDATSVKVLKVWVDGVEVAEYTDNTTGNTIDVQIDGTTGMEIVEARFAADAGGANFIPNTSIDAAKRRGHVELYLVTGHSPFNTGTGKITGGTQSKQLRVQSVSVDVSLDRENLAQLGSTYFYDRPLTVPLNVTASFDLTFSDLDMFAKFAGKNVASANEMRIDDFIDDVGMIVKVYDELDITTGSRGVQKEIHIPYLIPTDEAWNISLDGNATQTFSFRSHELYVKNALVS